MTLVHPKRSIKNHAVMFWNATFAHSRTLEYPETLRYIKDITSGNDIKIDSVVTFLIADNNPSTIHLWGGFVFWDLKLELVQEISYKKVGKGLTCNGVLAVFSKGCDPSHPNISVHILRTVHYTFLRYREREFI